ncbi:hypothetical protein LCGC14_1442940 [marine sediment metagenome]|uniref:Uncharacterized protein n=1 Tax=marine sediment metagenome TaxID=412755 RepID=A0A0F9M0I5_9ZZZZ
MSKVVLETRKYKAGYEVRTEVDETHFTAKQLSGSKDWGTDVLIAALNAETMVVFKTAYTPKGDYIGDKKTAHLLCSKKGIKPEKVHPSSNVCSIGFCEREQKWYGWSHRAIYGFGVGDVVEEGDCANSSGYTEEYLEDHPDDDLSLPVGFTAKDLIDAKRMAIAFADSVG